MFFTQIMVYTRKRLLSKRYILFILNCNTKPYKFEKKKFVEFIINISVVHRKMRSAYYK